MLAHTLLPPATLFCYIRHEHCCALLRHFMPYSVIRARFFVTLERALALRQMNTDRFTLRCCHGFLLMPPLRALFDIFFMIIHISLYMLRHGYAAPLRFADLPPPLLLRHTLRHAATCRRAIAADYCHAYATSCRHARRRYLVPHVYVRCRCRHDACCCLRCRY